MIDENSYSHTGDFIMVDEKYLYAVSMGTAKTDLVVYGTLEDVLKEYKDSEITHLGSAWRACE